MEEKMLFYSKNINYEKDIDLSATLSSKNKKQINKIESNLNNNIKFLIDKILKKFYKGTYV
ncbi:hypothetical protein [Mesomycoplasma lagogenitalium]|uniref:Uncharacterized protein n=1 Tax=Mesomycoplasma lagogenitalium TaxID=171286 RepID=A0ABY8LTU9_9BACT|nr:hypothetical protein [Mesomycoplasma lagogenitalium]WGI36666.1 hypothetical protein QEG99_00040 [Mesomycoplasma lagogenitalium]